MNIPDRKKEIHLLIVTGNLAEAIKRAMDYVEDFGHSSEVLHEIVGISSRYHAIQKSRQTGALNQDASSDQRNQLVQRMLELLDEVEKERLSIGEEALAKLEQETQTRKTVIEIAEVEKSFQSSNFHLRNINLTLHLGEITGIIGPNANGKSTLLKIIVGDLLKDKGKLRYPIFENKSGFPGWAYIKRHLAYIPQELTPWKGSLREVLLYEASRHGILGEDCELQVNFIVQRLGLADYIDLQWNQLSGGFKLRFELAKALVWKPTFVILDEPLANLDVSAQLTILNDLKNLAHGFKRPICVAITSQHIHEIEHIADNLLVLDNGRIIYFGKPLEFNSNNHSKIAELSCNADFDLISNALKTLDVRLDDRGYCVLIEMPDKYEMNVVIEELLKAGIKIEYFRDITHSVKQIFYENN